MDRVVYENFVLIDTSAVIAMFDSNDKHHSEATDFFRINESELTWYVANVTSHETYTHARYSFGWDLAHTCYDFLRSGGINLLEFDKNDENHSKKLLVKYQDQKFSYHDALCASVMIRNGIYRIFTFDKDFWILGFQIVPGYV